MLHKILIDMPHVAAACPCRNVEGAHCAFCGKPHRDSTMHFKSLRPQLARAGRRRAEANALRTERQ